MSKKARKRKKFITESINVISKHATDVIELLEKAKRNVGYYSREMTAEQITERLKAMGIVKPQPKFPSGCRENVKPVTTVECGEPVIDRVTKVTLHQEEMEKWLKENPGRVPAEWIANRFTNAKNYLYSMDFSRESERVKHVNATIDARNRSASQDKDLFPLEESQLFKARKEAWSLSLEILSRMRNVVHQIVHDSSSSIIRENIDLVIDKTCILSNRFLQPGELPKLREDLFPRNNV